MTEPNFYYLQVFKTSIMFGGFRKSCYLRNRKFISINVMALSIRDFRSRMAASFDNVDAGERVIIRRKHRLYAIVPVEDDEQTISPELQAKIEKGRKEYLRGETLHFETKDEMNKWLASL